MKNLIILLAIAPFFLGASCKKENLNDLPPATTTGKNIIGGYIDGQLFVSRRADLLSTDPGVIYYPAVPELGFGGQSVLTPDGPSVGFTLKENLNVGKLLLTPGIKNTGLLLLGKGDTNRYLPESGYINITRFDPTAKIYSGTFDVVFKSSSGEIMHFTEGRFDLLSF